MKGQRLLAFFFWYKNISNRLYRGHITILVVKGRGHPLQQGVRVSPNPKGMFPFHIARKTDMYADIGHAGN